MQSLTRRKLLVGAAVTLAAGSIGGAANLPAAQDAGELKFVMRKNSRGRFTWRLQAANGQVVATPGQSYAQKQNCRDAIKLIQEKAASATLDDRTKS